MKTKHLQLFLIVLGMTLLTAGCSDLPTTPLSNNNGPVLSHNNTATQFAPMEITFSGIGTGHISASAHSITHLPNVASAKAGESPHVARELSPITNLGDTLQLKPTNIHTYFEHNGVRYLSAQFKVRNPTNHDLVNLTFIGVQAQKSIGKAAVSELVRANNTYITGGLAKNIAAHTIPTNLLHLSGAEVTQTATILQFFSKSEANDILQALPSGFPVNDVYPWGFITKSSTVKNGNFILPGNAGPNQFDGTVSFAVRIPKQANASDNPEELRIIVLPIQDSQIHFPCSLSSSVSGNILINNEGSTITPQCSDPSQSYRYLDVGRHHTLAVRYNQTVFAWGGSDTYGEISGPNGFTSHNTVAVAAGKNHSLALTADGTVHGWGSNAFSQLPVPTNLTDGSVDIVGISAYTNHSAALAQNGTVYVWGQNGNGRPAPKPTLPVSNVIQVSSGLYNYSVVKSDGTIDVFEITYDSFQQRYAFVSTDESAQASKTIPDSLQNGSVNVVQVASGERFTVALDDRGLISVWGQNKSVFFNSSKPNNMNHIVQVAAGSRFIVALREDGTVTAWGTGTYGIKSQLTSVTSDDNGGTVDLTNPNEAHVVTISAGHFNAAALRANGTIVVWGYNNSGQLDGQQFGSGPFRGSFPTSPIYTW